MLPVSSHGPWQTCLRRSVAAFAVLALSFAAQSAPIGGSRPLAGLQIASAQSYCPGSPLSISANCSAGSGYQYCYQNGVQIVPSGQPCNTAVAYSCNGVVYATPVTCDGSGGACAGAGAVYVGQPCTGPVTSAALYPSAAYPSATPLTAAAYLGAIYPNAAYASAAPMPPVGYPGTAYPAVAAMTTSTYPATTSPSAWAPQGFLVSYAAGWNIVAGPTGTVPTGAAGPLYTLGPGDTTYRTLPPGSALSSGAGAWAYFSANTSTNIGLVNPASMTVPLPAGRFVLIGNPGDTTATVSGADAVLVYDTSTGTYHQSTLLAAGEGGWAVSINGGQATLTNAPAARGAEDNSGSD